MQQHMPTCGLVGDESPRYTVRDDVPTPSCSAIVCAKDRSVQVGGLVPNALVEIGVEGSDDGIFVMGASSDTASFPVPKGFLLEGMQIRFRQTLSCLGVAPIESAWSPSVAVQDLTSLALGNNPTIDPQPWSCGTKVRVRNVAPGSTVYVVSKFWGDRWSYPAQVPPDGKHQVDVDLFWGAMPDDTLTAEMVQCGQSTARPRDHGPDHDRRRCPARARHRLARPRLRPGHRAQRGARIARGGPPHRQRRAEVPRVGDDPAGPRVRRRAEGAADSAVSDRDDARRAAVRLRALLADVQSGHHGAGERERHGEVPRADQRGHDPDEVRPGGDRSGDPRRAQRRAAAASSATPRESTRTRT